MPAHGSPPHGRDSAPTAPTQWDAVLAALSAPVALIASDGTVIAATTAAYRLLDPAAPPPPVLASAPVVVDGEPAVFAVLVAPSPPPSPPRPSSLNTEAALRRDERRRIARGLHDTVVQDLLILHWHLTCRLGPDDAELAALAAAIAALRHDLTTIDRPVDPDTLVDALAVLTATATTPTSLTVSGHPAALAPDVAALVWRTVREALRNVDTHAAATAATVVVVATAPGVVVEVTDNGRGVDPATVLAARRRGHLGIASLYDDAHAAGATLTVALHDPRGTRVRLVLDDATR